MTTIDPKVKKRLEKLLALSERGEGGEKDNAQSMLDKALVKYGLCIDDLSGSSHIDTHSTKYYTQYDKKILRQIIVMVLGIDMNLYINKRRKRFIYDCTDEEQIEIELYFRILRKHLLNELDLTVSAFIQNHKLFDLNADARDSSEIDSNYLFKLRQRMDSVGTVSVHREIACN